MTTLTDTNDPNMWAEEFCRLFEVGAPPDLVAPWFKSAMETAIKLHEAGTEEVPFIPVTPDYTKYGQCIVIKTLDGFEVQQADDFILIGDAIFSSHIDGVTVEDNVLMLHAHNGVFRYRLGEHVGTGYEARRIKDDEEPPEETDAEAVVPE